MEILWIYLAWVNGVSFCVYGYDKWMAKKDKRRIPEKTLLLLAVIGGAIGALAGMYFFRHKTRHWYFVYGMPVILVLQIALIVFVLNGPFEIAIS